MNVQQKYAYAAKAIESIVRHDDASFGEVLLTAETLKSLIDSELQEAKARREARAAKAAGEKVTLTAADVGVLKI